jgi:hypothetical protein
LKAEIAVLLEGLVDDAAELGRQGRIDLIDRDRVAVQDRIEHHRRRLPLERQSAGRHLVEHGSDAE